MCDTASCVKDGIWQTGCRGVSWGQNVLSWMAHRWRSVVVVLPWQRQRQIQPTHSGLFNLIRDLHSRVATLTYYDLESKTRQCCGQTLNRTWHKTVVYKYKKNFKCRTEVLHKWQLLHWWLSLSFRSRNHSLLWKCHLQREIWE